MRKLRVKELRKEYGDLINNKILYNIKGQVVEGLTWRQFKKLNKKLG